MAQLSHSPSSMDTQQVEWAVASRPSPGEDISGDLHLVKTFPGGALAAVVDGLGHGEEATVAAKAAIDVLSAHANEPVIPLVERCHAALKNTRGAVMTVVSFSFEKNTMTALGVGNVEAILLHADRAAVPISESVLQRGGIVGDQLPAMRVSVFSVQPDDVLLFATDGIREGFWEQVSAADSLPQLVNRILGQSFRGFDDALVLAVRYLRNPT
jgi:negative regulator of sigma-B (phosphoserine phosphatase)